MLLLKAFRNDSRGVSAIEFAILGPLLAIMLGGILSVWTLAAHVLDMRHAVSVGAYYFIQGGGESEAATSAALSAWVKRGDGTLMITKNCYCGESANDCTTVCMPSANAPSMSVTIAASKTFDPPLFRMFHSAPLNIHHQEVVRVR